MSETRKHSRKDICDVESFSPVGEPLDASSKNEETVDMRNFEMSPASSLYTLKDLEKDRCTGPIPVASLPSWPAGTGHKDAHPQTGYGWGDHVGSLLGGGMRPGEIIAIGAGRAASGKTTFITHLAEGLALRNLFLEEGESLTPVFMFSEMSARELTWKAFARWTGFDANVFRKGNINPDKELADAAYKAARITIIKSALGEARRNFIFMPSASQTGYIKSIGFKEITKYIEKIRKELSEKYNREVVPIIVVDSIQYFQSLMSGEVEALNAAVDAVDQICKEYGCIALLTSETTKESAKSKIKANPRELGAGAFRGSYKLLHALTAAFSIQRLYDIEEKQSIQKGFALIELVPIKLRWGSISTPYPQFLWHLETGRFMPKTYSDVAAMEYEREVKKDKDTSANGQPIPQDLFNNKKEKEGKGFMNGDHPF